MEYISIKYIVVKIFFVIHKIYTYVCVLLAMKNVLSGFLIHIQKTWSINIYKNL